MHNGLPNWLSLFFGALLICSTQYSSAISSHALIPSVDKLPKTVLPVVSNSTTRLIRTTDH